MAWDDGDTETMECKVTLYAPSGGTHRRRSTLASLPLVLRLAMQKVSLKALFMSGSSLNITTPVSGDKPRGIFNLLLSTSGLRNRQLAKGLTGSETLVLSTQVRFRPRLGSTCSSPSPSPSPSPSGFLGA